MADRTLEVGPRRSLHWRWAVKPPPWAAGMAMRLFARLGA